MWDHEESPWFYIPMLAIAAMFIIISFVGV